MSSRRLKRFSFLDYYLCATHYCNESVSPSHSAIAASYAPGRYERFGFLEDAPLDSSKGLTKAGMTNSGHGMHMHLHIHHGLRDFLLYIHVDNLKRSVKFKAGL